MAIQIKRVYEPMAPADGYRVLVDRLWPRGLSKSSLKMDIWMKDISPSNELRKQFHHDPDRWEEFKKRYEGELEKQPELIEELLRRARAGRLTLLYAAKDETRNNAMALKNYLEGKLR